MIIGGYDKHFNTHNGMGMGVNDCAVGNTRRYYCLPV